jgi:DNA-binding transcriptional MocR family regulator
VPTNDNPTALTLEASERAAIAEVARRHDLRVIEDDAYGALPDAPIAPIAAYAPERCWYVASMSKIVSPALRVAYVRTPSVADALRLAGDVHETAVMAPPLNAAMVTAWMHDGMFDRLLGAMRAETAWRQELAGEMLGEVAHRRHPQGYHLWLELPPGMIAAELIGELRQTPLSLVAGERFAVEAGAPQAVRVSLGGAKDAEELARALRILHGHVGAPVRRSAPLV